MLLPLYPTAKIAKDLGGFSKKVAPLQTAKKAVPTVAKQ
jgi:hypothetical protein